MTRTKQETLKIIHNKLVSLLEGTPIGIVRNFEGYSPNYAKRCTIGFFREYIPDEKLSKGKIFYSHDKRSFNDGDDPGLGYFSKPIKVKLNNIRQINIYEEVTDTLQKDKMYFNDTEQFLSEQLKEINKHN